MKRFFNQVLCPLGGGLLLLFPGWFFYVGGQGNREAWMLMSLFLLGLFPLLYNRRIFTAAENFDSWREKKQGKAFIWRVFSVIGLVIQLCLLGNALFSWRQGKLEYKERIGWCFTAGYAAALLLLLLLAFLLTPIFRKRREKENARPEKMRRFDLSQRQVLGVIVFGWTALFLFLYMVVLFLRDGFWLIGMMAFVFSLYYMGYTWFLSYHKPQPCVRLFFQLANLWSGIFLFGVILLFNLMSEWLFPESNWVWYGVVIPVWTAGVGAIVSETVGYNRDIQRIQRDKNELKKQGEQGEQGTSLDASSHSSGWEGQG